MKSETGALTEEIAAWLEKRADEWLRAEYPNGKLRAVGALNQAAADLRDGSWREPTTVLELPLYGTCDFCGVTPKPESMPDWMCRDCATKRGL